MENSMNKNKTFKNLLFSCIAFISITTNAAHDSEIWIDYNNNTQLTLAGDGTFQFSNAASVTQGSYTVQNNVLMMQDSAGNHYQYNVVSYSVEQMVLSDQNGVSYSYVHSLKNNSVNDNVQSNPKLPWENSQYSTVLSQSNGYQWRERENWVYIEFLQFLIGQPTTQSEIAAIRQDFINQFNQRPEAFINEVNGIETTMKQVYSLTDMQQVAMVREEMSTMFNNLVKQQPQMNNYAFVQTLNKYVRILSVDTSSNLSLSNQDVDGYINYLQFQAMLMGQNYQLSQQDRMTLQVRLASEFNTYSVDQKQTLAFASFIWNNLAYQWSSMNASQQGQYITQVQNQMNVPNTNVNANEFWNANNNYDYSSNDISSMESRYRQEAAASGLSLNQYLDYKQTSMETDNMIFTAIQNNMTENHVMMMNMLSTDSDYEYVVDYGNNY